MALQNTLKELKEHEEELDRHLAHLESHKNDLKRDPIYARFAYVTHDDLEYLNKNRLLKASESDDNDSEDSDD